MALARPLQPLLQTLFPTLNGPVRPVLNLPLLQRLSQPFRLMPTPFAALALPSLSIPSFPSISDIWEGILKAVPKKKTSHRKKRQRFMAGKGLQDITSLNKCAACGRVKRAHILCTYCVNAIKSTYFKMKVRTAGHTPKQAKQFKRENNAERMHNRRMDADLRTTKPILEHPKKWQSGPDKFGGLMNGRGRAD
ncbi:hypothetical protein K504DRAFT_537863 [Pleomassaria siparia CBS 279.74]|uniref:Large ribosomal subunit protein bL32m n=1 Tax=Pleomassaria siparia CBS 279.74 TaxID=1314801 RepID=A0A6G1JW79_9PLEO|nr:hypothetical protein K504DRAFT_537863 [Pleomassaria siparia CBS 279.74]